MAIPLSDFVGGLGANPTSPVNQPPAPPPSPAPAPSRPDLLANPATDASLAIKGVGAVNDLAGGTGNFLSQSLPYGSAALSLAQLAANPPTTPGAAVGGADTITGDEGDDVIIGGADDDTISGNLGADLILGDSGQLDYTGGDLRTIASTASGAVPSPRGIARHLPAHPLSCRPNVTPVTCTICSSSAAWSAPSCRPPSPRRGSRRWCTIPSQFPGSQPCAASRRPIVRWRPASATKSCRCRSVPECPTTSSTSSRPLFDRHDGCPRKGPDVRALITGGAGFIGSHVVDMFVAEGHSVVVVDDLSTGRPENVNPKAKLCGLMLEDEGAFGSVHLALGSNADFGGKTRAARHIDLIISKSTLVLDGKAVLKDGQVVI